MNWVKYAWLVMELAVSFGRWVQDNKVADESAKEMLKAALDEIDDKVKAAKTARDSARAEFDNAGGVVRDDDPFLRD